MADDKARYKGHAVAAVAATSAHIAEAALELIEVDYEVLKPVLSIKDAMADDAPLLHENLTTHFKIEWIRVNVFRWFYNFVSRVK
jgi:CO/xanthine dehydrogenase Mo-binding subunit